MLLQSSISSGPFPAGLSYEPPPYPTPKKKKQSIVILTFLVCEITRTRRTTFNLFMAHINFGTFLTCIESHTQPCCQLASVAIRMLHRNVYKR